MTIRRKNCRYCGRPIDLREGADGTWRPYDLDGALHDCPALPASAQARSAPPPRSGTRAPAPSAARRSAPLWLALVGLLALLGWYALGGNRNAGPGAPAMDAPPAPTQLARAEPTRPQPRATDRVGEPPSSAATGGAGCVAFAGQVWAQTVYESAARVDPALDPDRDGLACEDLPPGAAPALWADRIPATAEPVALRSTIDGDTITVQDANGRRETVRLVGIDTPETGQGSRALECFGLEASDFTAALLSGIDTVWLEQDIEDRDRYDRLLRYVWFERDGRVYLANEAIVRSGAAERFRDTPNRRYLDELVAAEAFAREHGYGQWGACST